MKPLNQNYNIQQDIFNVLYKIYKHCDVSHYTFYGNPAKLYLANLISVDIYNMQLTSLNWTINDRIQFRKIYSPDTFNSIIAKLPSLSKSKQKRIRKYIKNFNIKQTPIKATKILKFLIIEVLRHFSSTIEILESWPIRNVQLLKQYYLNETGVMRDIYYHNYINQKKNLNEKILLRSNVSVS